MTPDEIALVITLIQAAVTTGRDMYDASQLKKLSDLEVKLTAQLADTAQQRVTANSDVAGRDAEIEAELALAQAPGAPKP